MPNQSAHGVAPWDESSSHQKPVRYSGQYVLVPAILYLHTVFIHYIYMKVRTSSYDDDSGTEY